MISVSGGEDENKYFSSSLLMVPLDRDLLVQPNNLSLLLLNIKKLAKTDDCLRVDNLRGVAGAVP
jgi:hypothetical protein